MAVEGASCRTLTGPWVQDRIWNADAGWSSPVARRAHNPKVGGSNPPPATIQTSKGLLHREEALNVSTQFGYHALSSWL